MNYLCTCLVRNYTLHGILLFEYLLEVFGDSREKKVANL